MVLMIAICTSAISIRELCKNKNKIYYSEVTPGNHRWREREKRMCGCACIVIKVRVPTFSWVQSFLYKFYWSVFDLKGCVSFRCAAK